jgi:predicted lipoprotein with Yx(FWY)xxD motif
MSRPHPRLIATLALGAALAVTLAACGGGSGSSSTTVSASTAAATTSSGSGTVQLADNSALGTKILVDAQGRTLYLFEKDQQPGSSTCSGACARDWPPLTTKGKATVGGGLQSSSLSTFKRDDGTTQVAYAGHPLYLYIGDTQPGDANGNAVNAYGAEWYAMDSGGQPVESAGSSGDTTSGYSPY